MNEKTTPAQPWTERTFDDIKFHVRARPSSFGLPTPNDPRTDRAIAIEYEVREVSVGHDMHDMNEEHPINLYRLPSSSDETTDIELADVWAHGTIKWDGCSHNHLPQYHHECSRQGMKNIGVLFDRLFDLALELMPDEQEYLR